MQLLRQRSQKARQFRRRVWGLRPLAHIIVVFTAACLALPLPGGAQTVNLPALKVDTTQISVSGLSSGGFMAVQFEVAYSASLKGAGAIAAGPYDCAQDNSTTAT